MSCALAAAPHPALRYAQGHPLPAAEKLQRGEGQQGWRSREIAGPLAYRRFFWLRLAAPRSYALQLGQLTTDN